MFSVCKIKTLVDYRVLANALDEWESISETKRHQARLSDQPLFSDSQYFTQKIKSISYESVEREGKEIYLCCDSVLQGVSVVEREEEDLRLDLLITHPRNILSHVNKDERKKGAGSALIFTLFSECLDLEKKGVIVEATRHSSSFYEKFGFEGVSFSFFMDRQGEMKISSEKIQDILRRNERFF